MLNNVDASRNYKTQWMAYFKSGLASPTIVYGESKEEAKRNALAYWRKNRTPVDFWPKEKIVDYVTYIG